MHVPNQPHQWHCEQEGLVPKNVQNLLFFNSHLPVLQGGPIAGHA